MAKDRANGKGKQMEAFEAHASFPQQSAGRDRAVMGAIRSSLAARATAPADADELDPTIGALVEHADFPDRSDERDAEVLGAISAALAFRKTFERGAVNAARVTRMPHRSDARDEAMATEVDAALAFRRAFVEGEAARDFPGEAPEFEVGRRMRRVPSGRTSKRPISTRNRRRPSRAVSRRKQSSGSGPWIALAAGIAAAAIVISSMFGPDPTPRTPVVVAPKDKTPKDKTPNDGAPKDTRPGPKDVGPGSDDIGPEVPTPPLGLASPDERLAAASHSIHRLSRLLDDAEAGDVEGASDGFTQRVAGALLALDRGHARANQVFGRVLFEGRWMSTEERGLRQRQLAARGGDGSATPPMSTQFGEMLAAAGKDVDELWRVAQWARRHKLEAQARMAAERVLENDPEHSGAHLALDHEYFDETKEWLTRAEVVARSGATVSAMDSAPAWLEVLGPRPMMARRGRVDVWMQRPRGASAKTRKDLDSLADQIQAYTEKFVKRQGKSLRRMGYETSKAVDRHRLTVAVFTQKKTYASFADAQGEQLARDQAGFVPMSLAVALVRTPAQIATEKRPFYDQFLLASYRPRSLAEGHRRVLWSSGIDAQARFGHRVLVDSTEHFVVTAKDTPKNRKTVPQVVARVAELEQQMRDGGLLIKQLKRTCSVILCDGDAQYQQALSHGSRSQQVSSWGGTYEPTRAQWICETRFQDDVLHGAALMLLHQVTTRLPKNGDLFFYHEGIAHLAAGQALGLRRGVHARWARLAKMHLARKTLLPISQLLADNRGQVLRSKKYREDPSRYHAQSWALTHYLWHTRGGAYRPRMLALLRTCNYQTVDRAKFAKMMQIRDLEAFERGYLKYIEKLKVR